MAHEPQVLRHKLAIVYPDKVRNLQVLGQALTNRSHEKLLCEMECAARSHSMLSERNLERYRACSEKQEDVASRQGRPNGKNVPRQKYVYAERGNSDLALDPRV
jgi:hypothetical protein